MIAVRAYLDSDFDAVVPAWHETNLLTYTYVRAHQEHSLDDALRFFRDVLLKECRVWVAKRASRPAGVMATQEAWIRQFAVFPPFQRQGSERRCSPRRASSLPGNCGSTRFNAIMRLARSTSIMDSQRSRSGISPAPEFEPDVEYRWQADTDAEG